MDALIDALIERTTSLRSTAYIAVACAAVVYYNHLLTFDKEGEFRIFKYFVIANE